MITRIEIDGFKTFQDFALDLAPFQVIIGPNGCGKSNLFDAIRLLSKLADSDLRSSFQNLRGEFFEQFTIQPDGKPGKSMRFAVEMLVDRVVRDNWGAEVRLPNPRLRYEVEIVYNSPRMALPELYIANESLKSIGREDDSWSTSMRSVWASLTDVPYKSQEFMSSKDRESPNNTLTFHPDEAGITPRESRATVAFSSQTGLSRIDNCDFPHILAARQEMKKWQSLEGRPEILRLPSMRFEDSSMLVGSNIPFLLFRMKQGDEMAFHAVSRDLANLVPNMRKVDVEWNEYRNQYEAYAIMTDGLRISARILSDGIVRLLALATVKNLPDTPGVFLLEEPENSIHPGQLKRLVRLMRAMTTALTDPEQSEEPLRQLLVTTHSPTLVSELNIANGELLFAELVMRVVPRVASMLVTRITPVQNDSIDAPERAYAVARVIEYLNNANFAEVRSHLREALTR